jgi:hypothetical protein
LLEIKTKQKKAKGKTDLFCHEMQSTSNRALSFLVCSGEQAHFLGHEIQPHSKSAEIQKV